MLNSRSQRNSHNIEIVKMVMDLKKKRVKKEHIFLLCICACVFTGLSLTLINVLGKYYASRNNKGIAVASNLYFNSDKLIKSAGITDIDEIIKDSESINKINVFTNSGSWASGELLLNFDIRNFDNNILYNEKELDIKYKIEFVLLDEPIGARYAVSAGNDTQYVLNSKGSKVSLEGTTKGGSLYTDTYGISMIMTDKSILKPARVLVVAYPVSPDYIHREPDKVQEYRLLGIFQGHPTDLNISIEEAYFKVQKENEYDTKWRNMIEDLSGYIYNIKTAGDVVFDDNNSTRQEAVVTWDNRYITIDRYDPNYMYAAQHDAGLDADSQDRYIKTDGNNTSMTIMVLPYTSINMTFYKTTDFNSGFSSVSGEDGKVWFESLVTAKMAE